MQMMQIVYPCDAEGMWVAISSMLHQRLHRVPHVLPNNICDLWPVASHVKGLHNNANGHLLHHARDASPDNAASGCIRPKKLDPRLFRLTCFVTFQL